MGGKKGGSMPPPPPPPPQERDPEAQKAAAAARAAAHKRKGRAGTILAGERGDDTLGAPATVEISQPVKERTLG